MSRKNSGVKPMTEAQLQENLQAQEAAAQGAENVVAETPAQIEVEVAPAPVAVEWQPMPNYQKTAVNTVARAQVAPHSPQGAVSPASVPVLLTCATPNVRPGTARAAALAALAASVGQPRPVVLANVLAAEMHWHKANGRTPGNLAPTGWLRTFGAVFGPAPVAEVAQETAQESAEA